MGVFKNVRSMASGYAALLKEKNRRLAIANRLRTVIQCEEKAADKEYMALGRYYYNALRDKDNAIAEAHCARIDESNARRDSTLEALQALEQEEAAAIGVIGGEDGPTAVFTAGKGKASIGVIEGYDRPATGEKKSIFHFEKGPIEITLTKEEPEEEEIDLSDVEVYDQDPTALAEEEPKPRPVEAAPAETESVAPTQPAEPDENDNLPFEG